MTGTLGLFSLVDLFQLLAASARSGRLSVAHPEGKALIFFDQGNVVHADFAGQIGAAAVYALFADERGSFEFRLGQAAPQVSVTMSTQNLLFEATRRLDETRHSAADHAGSARAVSTQPRTARLVTQLSRESLPGGVVGLDANIHASWERALGHAPTRVACRRADGHTDVFKVRAVAGAGPYLLVSRETLFGTNLGVNVTLLVKPWEAA